MMKRLLLFVIVALVCLSAVHSVSANRSACSLTAYPAYRSGSHAKATVSRGVCRGYLTGRLYFWSHQAGGWVQVDQGFKSGGIVQNVYLNAPCKYWGTDKDRRNFAVFADGVSTGVIRRDTIRCVPNTTAGVPA